MSQIIKVEGRVISGEEIQTISARELHHFLEVATRFNGWIGARMSITGLSKIRIL